MIGGVFGSPAQVASRLTGDELAEGALWTLWLGHSYREWKQTVDSATQSAADKAACIWLQSKQALVKTCGLLSSFTGVVGWAANVGLITLGSFLPIVSAAGYWASSVVQSSKLSEGFRDLVKDLSDYAEVYEPNTKGELAFRSFRGLVKIAFATSLVGWSVFGGLHALLGGLQAELIMHQFLYIGVVLFCVHLAMILIEPRSVSKQASS